MALILLGKSLCCICQRVIEEGQLAKGFPPFKSCDQEINAYSDAPCHVLCFEALPEETRNKITKTINDLKSDHRRCSSCGKEILSIQELLQTPIISKDYPEITGFDSLNLHKQCFLQSGGLHLLSELLSEKVEVKVGAYQKYRPLIKELDAVMNRPSAS
jgi:hypothetical protein